MEEFKLDPSEYFSQDIKPSEESVNKKIYNSIEAILLQRFPDDVAKRTIETTSKGYNIACPYCGDSKKDSSKKRGYVYLKTSSFKCWNGGCYIYRPLDIMLSNFKVGNLTYAEKEALSLNYIIHNSSNKKSLAEFYNSSTMVEKSKIMKAHYLKSISSSNSAFQYLSGRNAIFSNMDDFAWNEKFNNLYFFNMFEGRVLGVQIRLGTPMKNGGRFISYDYGDLHAKILKTEEFDHDLAEDIKRTSLIYNILNIDFSTEVNVFESTLDSKYFNNSIALWGSGNILNIANGVYYFDDDVAGRSSAVKMLNEGRKVFLWRKFKKENPKFIHCNDINDIKKKDGNFDVRKLKSHIGDSVFDKNWL